MKLFDYFWLKFVKVNIDNPAALQFIMQDDIFLLKSEKDMFSNRAAIEERVAEAVAAEEKIAEPAQTVKAVEVTPVLQQPVKQAPVIKYRGSNKSGYVVLVHYPTHEWMADAHLSALENTLKRKSIEPADIAIINMALHNGLLYEDVSAQLKPQKLLLMGKAALPAGMAAVNYNQLHQLAGITTLYTFSFDEMMDSNENKKIFWEQMKVL